MDIQDPVSQCYEWQKGSMRFESRTKKMKEELESIGLAKIWQSVEKGHQQTNDNR
jgi:hypothetical protein